MYVENRQQFVEFRNTKSNILQISTGVPPVNFRDTSISNLYKSFPIGKQLLQLYHLRRSYKKEQLQ